MQRRHQKTSPNRYTAHTLKSPIVECENGSLICHEISCVCDPIRWPGDLTPLSLQATLQQSINTNPETTNIVEFCRIYRAHTKMFFQGKKSVREESFRSKGRFLVKIISVLPKFNNCYFSFTPAAHNDHPRPQLTTTILVEIRYQGCQTVNNRCRSAATFWSHSASGMKEINQWR